MIFGAALITDGSGDLVDQIPVPGGSHANRLRKNGRAPVGGHTMQSFAPKVVVGNAQARHPLRRMVHHPDFFIEGQAGEQILNSFRKREIGVQISRLVHRRSLIRECLIIHHKGHEATQRFENLRKICVNPFGAWRHGDKIYG